MSDPQVGLTLWLRRLMRRTELDADDQRRVLALPGRVERVRTNHDFVRLNQRVDECCLIVSGIAARFGQTRNGLRQLSALHVAGDCADLHSAVLPNSGSALSAVSDVVLYRMPHPAVHEIVRGSTALARAMWRDCTVDAAIAAEWLLNNGRRDARTRLAHLICELAMRIEAVGGDRHRFTLEMSQMHFGDALGLTSVHVNRMMRELREARLLIVNGREFEICDWTALADAGDFDPYYLHLTREHPETGEGD